MNAVRQSWDDELRAWWPGATNDPPPLTVISRAINGLFLVDTFSGVTVSTDQAEGIALFASVTVVQYLRVCAALRLVQWRALEQNDILFTEDFAHSEPSDCLFVRRARKCDYALAFERPCICYGCFEFYHCLGAEREIVSAAQLLHSLRITTPDNPRAQVPR